MIALAIFCVLFAAARPALANPPCGRQVATDQLPNTPQEGNEPPFDPEVVFLQVWERVRDSFYRADFNGVDWNSVKDEMMPRVRECTELQALAAIVNEALRRLNTSHTGFYTDADVEFYHLLDIFSSGSAADFVRSRFSEGHVRYTSIGVLAAEIDGQWFVRGVFAGSPADQAGLRRGQRLISVDGEPFQPIRSFQGRAGEEVTLTVQSSAESTSRQTVRLTPIEIKPQQYLLQAMERSMKVVEHQGRRIAYVRIWSYAGEPFHELLKERVRSEPLASAEGLIIDLRDGWGGASPEYLNLFNRRIPQMRGYARDSTSIYLDSQWRKPVVLLVNEGSRSGKELLAYGFRKYQIGPVVGARTAGAVVGGSLFPIGDDAVLYLACLGIEVDGEVLEGRGVEPDIPIEYPLPYGAAMDPQLEAALSAFR